jgi:hypothetical protein
VRFEVEIESLGPALGFDVPFDPKAEVRDGARTDARVDQQL